MRYNKLIIKIIWYKINSYKNDQIYIYIYIYIDIYIYMYIYIYPQINQLLDFISCKNMKKKSWNKFLLS